MNGIILKSSPKLTLSGHEIAGYLNWIADTLEPNLRNAYLTAIESVAPEVTKVAEAIRNSGSPFTPDVEAAIANVIVPIDPLQDVALKAYALGGTVGYKLAHPTFKLSFDLTNPRSAVWSEAHAAALVKYISDPARDALRQAITSGYKAGLTVDATARYIQDHQMVGLLPQHVTAVTKYKLGLQQDGKTPQRVTALTDRYADRLLRYRAENIARTEIIGSANAGQMDYWRSASDAGFISPSTQREWITAIDERTCPVCRGLDGKKSSMEGQFWADSGFGYFMPPAHPSCRCAMGLVITLERPSYDSLSTTDVVPALQGYPGAEDVTTSPTASPTVFLSDALATIEGTQVQKYNHAHDKSNGQFASTDGGADAPGLTVGEVPYTSSNGSTKKSMGNVPGHPELEMSIHQWERQYGDPIYSMRLWKKNTVMGTVSLSPDKRRKTMSVSMVEVNPDQRGKNYADMLMSAVYDHLAPEWTVRHHDLTNEGAQWLEGFRRDHPELDGRSTFEKLAYARSDLRRRMLAQ